MSFQLNQNSPMMGKNFDSPGNYELITRTNKTIINSGGIVIVDILITGYGKIPNSKLVFYPSGEILNLSHSKVYANLFMNESNQLLWGKNEVPLLNEGLTIGMTDVGFNFGKWDNSTQYFDITHGPSPQISTEAIMNAHKPPFQFHLKTNEKIKPGTYSLHFGFTYFNSVEWKGSTLKIDFTVRNIFQRYELLISWIASIAAAISIVAAILQILEFYKK